MQTTGSSRATGTHSPNGNATTDARGAIRLLVDDLSGAFIGGPKVRGWRSPGWLLTDCLIVTDRAPGPDGRDGRRRPLRASPIACPRPLPNAAGHLGRRARRPSRAASYLRA